ncbi:MAG: nucleotide exchange factor GrpE [Candidatus Helarchaeota archaeon]
MQTNKLPSDKKDLAEKIDKNNEDNYKEKYYRAKAELENYRKFMEKQKLEYIKFANEEIILEFLKVYDDLKRAINSMDSHDKNIEAIKKGLKLILENFRKILEKQGVKPIECIGEIFDPNKHEVLMVEKSTKSFPDGLIIEELEEGYTLNGKIIRPSRVKIIKNN